MNASAFVPTQAAFQPGRVGILFFSRGRGYGHAIPDMAIADNLLKLRHDLDLRFVSYGSGGQAFREDGRPVIDLEMPDANALCPTIAKTGQLIRKMGPDLVISHEEYTVLPVAKVFGLSTVVITEWFSDPDDDMMQSLSYANEVIVAEDEGIFDEPPNVQGRVSYVGPVLRSFSYSRADRSRARQELGLPQDATILLAIPGGWATEDREQVAQSCFSTLRIVGVVELPGLRRAGGGPATPVDPENRQAAAARR